MCTTEALLLRTCCTRASLRVATASALTDRASCLTAKQEKLNNLQTNRKERQERTAHRGVLLTAWWFKYHNKADFVAWVRDFGRVITPRGYLRVFTFVFSVVSPCKNCTVASQSISPHVVSFLAIALQFALIPIYLSYQWAYA